jgi:hypothetical protein
MNKKRDEIERFIENDLLDAVEDEFGEYSNSKQANLREEVEAIKSEIREKLGDDALDENDKIKPIFVTTPFAKELSERYVKVQVNMKHSDMSDQHEGEIFSHIYQFFSRYYDNGDFMSLRRYSQKEKYAIPHIMGKKLCSIGRTRISTTSRPRRILRIIHSKLESTLLSFSYEKPKAQQTTRLRSGSFY